MNDSRTFIRMFRMPLGMNYSITFIRIFRISPVGCFIQTAAKLSKKVKMQKKILLWLVTGNWPITHIALAKNDI